MTVPLPSGESSATLLQRFADDRNEAAFRSLVDQYLPLVMAAALRRTGGQRAPAEEAAKTAFTDLAKRATTNMVSIGATPDANHVGCPSLVAVLFAPPRSYRAALRSR